MEPWDGPAALAMTDGRWVCAGLDRNGLRPMRYVVTGDGLVIAGSEAGMVPTDEATVVEKGALGPGRCWPSTWPRAAVPRHRDQGQAGRAQPFGDWVGKINELDEHAGRVTEAPMFHRRRAAQAADRGGLHHRGAGADPRADGRGRQGSARLDGRRHAVGGAVEEVPAAQPFLPAELQPGDEPADRQLARIPGDEPQDPVRQPQERARRGAAARPRSSCWKAPSWAMRSSTR
jgi:hypothetical protein